MPEGEPLSKSQSDGHQNTGNGLDTKWRELSSEVLSA
jgi:hypothetical protein